LALALIWIASATSEWAQQGPTRDAAHAPTSGTASIAGTVVADDDAQTPIAHAVVTLMTVGTVQRTTATDARGRYVFAALAVGTYTLSMTRGAYLTTSYGSLGPSAPPVPIPLKEGQQFVARPVVLVRGGVITGKISDAEGLPAANARVVVMRVVADGADRRPSNSAIDRGNTTTDSRGVYRIYGLPPGDYVVSAAYLGSAQSIYKLTDAEVQWAESRQTTRVTAPAVAPPPARPFSPAPTYFPGVADFGDAALVSVGRADERVGVDFAVLRVATARLSGVVYGLDGQVAPGAIVVRAPKQTASFTLSVGPGQTRSGPDGSFAFTGVSPGNYTLTARASAQATAPPPGPGGGMALPSGPLTLWGQADVSMVGDDVGAVSIHLQPGMTLSGTIAFEGVAPPPADMSKFQPKLTAMSADASVVTVDQGATSAPKADRTFAIVGVSPGAYLLSGSGDRPVVSGTPPAWTIKSVMAGGHDLLNTPFDVQPREDLSGIVVTYTDRHTELDGQLRDAAGQPVSDYRVLAFSANRDRWAAKILPRWMASVRAGVDGSFRIVGLPPGEYYICAVVDSSQAQSPDTAALLTSLVPASIKVTLAEGTPVTQTFKVGG
jgi:protocatechuate 3,4-dioxygenase beta subunit